MSTKPKRTPRLDQLASMPTPYDKALALTCGEGWKSPEDVEKLESELEYFKNCTLEFGIGCFEGRHSECTGDCRPMSDEPCACVCHIKKP